MAYQPINTITSALRSIGALATGETPDAATANDCFNLLNERIDQFSNDHLLVFAQQEIIQPLTPGQFTYTIGPNGSVGSSILGTINGTTLTVSSILSGDISSGQILLGNGIINGTAITSLQGGLGGANGTGTYQLNIANNIFGFTGTASVASVGLTATLTVTTASTGAVTLGQVFYTSTAGSIGGTAYVSAFGTGTGGLGTYTLTSTSTIPTLGAGTVVLLPAFTTYAPRPMRINSAFVRVVNSATGTLDYPVAILAFEQYQQLGIKTLPGPWPRALYYQPTIPLGILNYWPNPSQGEMHLFCDTPLNNFASLYDNVVLPQGYQSLLHWDLAEVLMPEFGKKDPAAIQMVMKQAMLARKAISKLNQKPQMPSQMDTALQQRATKNAGWILSGGQ